MKIESYIGGDENCLPLKSYEKIFLGKGIDDRGSLVSDWCKSNCKSIIPTNYDHEDKSIELEGVIYYEKDIAKYLNKFKDESILLEATTLGTAELCQLLYYLKECGTKSVDLLYLEPKSYKKDEKEKNHLERKYDLSNKVNCYSPIPPLFLDLNSGDIKKALFMVGFEGYRLFQLFTHHEAIKSFENTAFVGVPPFSPGYELNAMVRNMQSFDEQELIQNIKYCGANNVEQVFRGIEMFMKGLSESDRMIIAPIGTKPMAIAAILAAIKNKNRIGIMYDHPEKKEHRSKEANNWSLYKVTF